MPSFYRVKDDLLKGRYDSIFSALYSPDTVERQVKRYLAALERFANLYGDEREVFLFSAPGRTEIGGNHTDHQCGRVLAAAVNLDMIAVVSPNTDHLVRLKSYGYNMDTVSIDELQFQQTESGTSASIIRGILARFKELGHHISGFDAYTTSDVLKGSGLSSSAAYEVMIGTILNHLYNGGRLGPVEIAKIGKFAENAYFKKPCGLMDQTACAMGGFVAIDFKDPEKPKVEKVDVDFEAYHYSLCIVDVKASHSDLTYAYALVPEEMKKVCDYFGKKHLREIEPEEFYTHIPEIRKVTGDRAVLRAIHFYGDNERVQKEVDALKNGEFKEFLKLVKESGDSSFKYLQNIYTNEDVQNQSMSIALAVSERVLGGHGVCRVHGGGFAGTIQVFVENDFVETYRRAMDEIFGAGACHVLKVRKYGGLKVM